MYKTVKKVPLFFEKFFRPAVTFPRPRCYIGAGTRERPPAARATRPRARPPATRRKAGRNDGPGPPPCPSRGKRATAPPDARRVATTATAHPGPGLTGRKTGRPQHGRGAKNFRAGWTIPAPAREGVESRWA